TTKKLIEAARVVGGLMFGSTSAVNTDKNLSRCSAFFARRFCGRESVGVSEAYIVMGRWIAECLGGEELRSRPICPARSKAQSIRLTDCSAVVSRFCVER